MSAVSPPAEVTIPVDVVIDMLATIASFEQRLYATNGRQDTPETDEIAEEYLRLFKAVFGPEQVWDDEANVPTPLFDAVRKRGEQKAVLWATDVLANALREVAA